MRPNPDFSADSGLVSFSGQGFSKPVLALACAVLAVALSSGCSAQLPSHDAAQAASNTPPPVKVQPAPVVSPPVAPVVIAPVVPESPSGEPTLRILAYAERVRQLQGPELNLEIVRQSESSTPSAQLQLSLALSQLRQLPELLRAQELLARVLGNPEAAPLHPLARLLASRYVEQRRLEEQIERQAQQLRDTQRRLDQTNDRLEALKAIERSLVSRPPGAASAPSSPGRSRSAP